MKTIAEIRRKNFHVIVEKHGGVSKLGNKLDRSQAQISHWLHGFKLPNSDRRRAMNDDSARFVEESLGLVRGWMDSEHPGNGKEYRTKSDQAASVAAIVDSLDDETRRDHVLNIVKAYANVEDPK